MTCNSDMEENKLRDKSALKGHQSHIVCIAMTGASPDITNYTNSTGIFIESNGYIDIFKVDIFIHSIILFFDTSERIFTYIHTYVLVLTLWVHSISINN